MNLQNTLFMGLSVCFFAGFGTLSALCDSDNAMLPPVKESALEHLNKDRVSVKEKGLLYYVVPAMSDVQRLSDKYPSDGEVNGVLRIVAAQNEFEPASFQMVSNRNLEKVTLSVSDLTGPNGAKIPASALDLKVVKIWYQNGNAWNSYFSDVGLTLTPELLVNDENMILTDTVKVANYARIQDPAGERFVWISGPQKLETLTFEPCKVNFKDAETLQPVRLDKDAFKQFFLTVHVPKDQQEGLYKGFVKVDAPNEKLSIPVTVKVLPFELPNPRWKDDLEKPFFISVMGIPESKRFISRFETPEEGRDVYLKSLRKLLDHGVLHPPIAKEDFALYKQFGIDTSVMTGDNMIPHWYGRNFGGRLNFEEHQQWKEHAKKCSEFYKKHFGDNNVLLSYGDEQGANFVTAYRKPMNYYNRYNGLFMGCAGHGPLMYKGGYVYGNHPLGGYPDDFERAKPWYEIGNKWVGFYAGQHTGSENPQFIRRQNGLLGYFNGMNMIYNYEFADGPWNDLAWDLYKPMVISYRNRGGYLDTLQFEGFREAVDDLRYVTKLRMLCRDAIASGNLTRATEARKALQYLALLKPDEMDLNTVRLEMIRYIMNLIRLEEAKG